MTKNEKKVLEGDAFYFGYIRVSKIDQDTQRQEMILQEEVGEELKMVFSEKISGTKRSRPELNRLKAMVLDGTIPKGSVLVVESFTRLSRSLLDLFTLLDFFAKNDIEIWSIKENFDTSTPQGRFSRNMFLSLAEYERDMIAQRTQESLAARRKNGEDTGRPKLPQDTVELILLLNSTGKKKTEIAKMANVSRTTVYNVLNEEKERLEAQTQVLEELNREEIEDLAEFVEKEKEDVI